MLKKHAPVMIVVCASTLVVSFFYGEIPYMIEPFASWDLMHYRQVAAAAPVLDANVEQPFGYRLLGPYLVGLLPVPDTLGFRVLSVVASLTLVALFYSFMCSVGIGAWASAITAVLFTCNRTFFGVPVWNYFQLNDVLALNFLVIMFWAMLRGKWAVFGAALIFGALARETAVLMIPVAFAFLIERRRLDQLKALVLAALPGVLLFFLVRASVPAIGEYSLLSAFLEHVTKLKSPEVWYRLLVNPFVPFTFLPFVFWPTTRAFISQNRYMLVFVALVFVSALFGTDNERLMAPTFIVFYLLLAHVIQAYGFAHVGLLIGLAVGALLSFPHHIIARYPLPSREVAILVSVLSLMMGTAVGFAYRIIGRGRQVPAEGADQRKFVV